MASYTQIKARIEKLEREAEQVLRKEAVKAIDAIKKIMEKYQITLADLGESLSGNGAATGRRGRKPKAAAAKSPKGARQKPAAKYRNPKTGETWSGMGRPPAWIRDAHAAGKQDKFLIDGAAEPKAAKARAASRTGRGKSASKAAGKSNGAARATKSARAARSALPAVKEGRKRRAASAGTASAAVPKASEGEASAAAE